MPADKVVHYNRIDIGIFLCFLELYLIKNDIVFERELFTDTAEDECEEVLTAKSANEKIPIQNLLRNTYTN